jgi:outer membrane protein assembly factor BamE (lipoprotein component of BamABCDE complex)
MKISSLFGVLGILLCSACQVTHNRQGYVFDPKAIASLCQGKSTKEDVSKALGTPTCILSYDPNTWYYLSEHLETESFLEPKVTEILCYMLEFSPTGCLKRLCASKKAIEIGLCPEAIPLPSSHGGEFLKQLFRNTGRFKTLKTPGPTRR